MRLERLLLTALLLGSSNCGARPELGPRTPAPASGGGSAPVTPDGPQFYEDNPTYASPPAALAWPQSAALTQAVDDRTLAAADSYLQTVPQAFSFLVIRNGYLVHERYFHGSGPTQSNNIHSASKSLLGSLVGIAIDKGLIRSIDERVHTLLPERKLSGSAKQRLTLKHLLTMSSGFDWTEDQSESTIQRSFNWVQAILDLPLSAPPGQTFNYCTGNTHLLSAILTRATGMSTADFARQVLLDPLGIEVEHWGHDPQGINSGGYNVYMTPRALAKFALTALNHGVYNGRQLIPAAWLDASWQPQESVDDVYSYGYLWWLLPVDGHRVYKMWGYGGQYALLLPDFNTVVVLTANTAEDFEEMDADDFLDRFIIPALR